MEKCCPRSVGEWLQEVVCKVKIVAKTKSATSSKPNQLFGVSLAFATALWLVSMCLLATKALAKEAEMPSVTETVS